MLLVGRDVPLAACSAALGDAAGGRGRVVLLAGEAGIGKTTLARAVADEAAAAGAVVRWTAAWEGGDVPLAPWIEALRVPGGDACEGAAARLADGSGVDTDDPTATEHLRLHLFAGVVDALRAAAAVVPQVLVLDDLHWADTTSLLLLRAVAAHAPTMRLLVVGTYRDDEVRSGSPLLALGGSAECHGLTGLREGDVAELLTAVVGRIVGPDESRSVSRQTGGNPLFVTHVGRLLAAGAPMGVPTGVRDVLARRLARLPAACDEVLGAAAILGQEFEPAVVGEILGVPVPDVLGALDAAAAARIAVPVDGRPDRWAFTHALVQTTRYDGLGSPDRASLHRRACDVLQRRSGTAAAVLAHHAARGSYASDDATPATLLLHAADEARSRLAVEEALPLYEAALERAARLPDGAEVEGAAWLGLGDVRLRMGDAPGAARCFEAGADLARRLEAPDLLARAALGFGAGLGGFEVRLLDQRQTDLLEEAAATLPPSSPLRPLVLARLSVAISFVGSEERRLALADEALALGRAAGDLAAVGAALASRCDAIAGPRFTTERLGVAGEIVAIGQRLGDRRLELLGRRHRAAALAELCDLDGFDAEVAAFARTADVLGDPLYSWYVPLWRGMRAVTAGHLAEGSRLSAEARAIGERAGSPNARVLSQVLDLFVVLLSGTADELEAGIRILTEELPDALLANGNPMTAYSQHLAGLPGGGAHARQVRAAVDRMPMDAEWLATVAPLTDLASDLGRVDAAADLYRRFAPFAGLGVVEGIAAMHRGAVDRYLMVLAAMLGDEVATLAHLERSLEIGARIGPLLLADAQQAGAASLRRLDPDRFADRAAALDAQATGAFRDLRIEPQVRPAPTPAPVPPVLGTAATLVREGDTWAVTWEGATARVRHAKGVADLAVLLARAGREVHVRELEGVPDLPSGSRQAVLDEEAVAAYRRRLRDVEQDLDEAEGHGDLGHAARLAAERDALVAEITGAFGLGGRARSAGSDPDERLRKAVSARVRSSIERLEALHPLLGRHLRNSVRTGLWCSYQPERPVTWEVSGRSR